MSSPASPRSSVRKRLLFVALVTGVVFLFIEGLSSTTVSLFRAVRQTTPFEATRHDSTLGWEPVPSAHLPDMYGPGKYVRTNSRGFRDDAETPLQPAPGKRRLVCSGDSFTYGQGVANDQTWCHRLAGLDDRLETVNLALPGYGVDQMYLRYVRDGVELEHAVHVFAFVIGDLTRMGFGNHHGYGRPLLAFDGDELVVSNAPIPRFRWWLSRAALRADFRFATVIRSALRRASSAAPDETDIIERVGPVAERVFETVQQMADERNVVPVFILLPTEQDLHVEKAWRPWIHATMERLGLSFIDLTPAFRDLPAFRAHSYLIPRNRPAGGHYTETGNEWAAAELYARLLELPPLADLLAADPATNETGRDW